MAQDRVTIQEAAKRLGVKEDAIRKRIQRGSLRHEKTEEGRVFVWVDAAQYTTQDATEDAYQDTTHDALLGAKDETIAALREQLAQANERDRENRRLLAAALERIPPQLEAPSEARESTQQTVEQEQEIYTERARRKMAESTMHEGMDEERWRREEAERERDELRQELYALREPRESPETGEEQQGRGEPHPATGEPQESSGGRGSGTARGSLWRRIFGR